MKEKLGLPIAVAILASGCSTESANSHNEDPNINAIAQLIAERDALDTERTEEFTLDTDQLKKIDERTITGLDQKSHEIAYYSTSALDKLGEVALSAHQLGYMLSLALAHQAPTTELSYFSPETGEKVSSTDVHLVTTDSPTVVVLAEDSEMDIGRPEANHTTRAITYPAADERWGWDTNVTFIEKYSQDEFAIAQASLVEACQAAVSVREAVEAYNHTNDIVAQEIICNSFGIAVSFAALKTPYAEYKEASDKTNLRVISVDGQTMMPNIIFSEEVYDELTRQAVPVNPFADAYYEGTRTQ